jgi:hypothetical protein
MNGDGTDQHTDPSRRRFLTANYSSNASANLALNVSRV